jgi:hypothetical protein
MRRSAGRTEFLRRQLRTEKNPQLDVDVSLLRELGFNVELNATRSKLQAARLPPELSSFTLTTVVANP